MIKENKKGQIKMLYDLTKEETIQRHRDLWTWIYKETIRQRYGVDKVEYFKDKEHIPDHFCYLCEYDHNMDGDNCSNCLCKWKQLSRIGYCPCNNSYYGKFNRTDHKKWIKRAYYAWRISKLKVRKDI